MQELGDNEDDRDEDKNDGSWHSLSTYSKTHMVLGAFPRFFLLTNLWGTSLSLPKTHFEAKIQVQGFYLGGNLRSTVRV